jgi:UDP-N-acetylmuramoyl-L-alanyl-D-glutamate--2,6-diaminopimelate ligase
MDTVLYYLKRLIPTPLFKLVQPGYHFLFAALGALIYRMPSRELTVIGVTGTKGKSTVTELVNAIFEAAGKKTALMGTIRFKIGEDSRPNLYKMTMPGRFFVQKFLREAVDAGCEIAVIEMTSEGVKQFRHKFIDLDALIFTNLSPEHIESHGSYEKYIAAKLQLARALEDSTKRPRFMVANKDDEHGHLFLEADVEHALPYSLHDLELYNLNKEDVSLVLKGTTIRVPLVGLFNVYNALAAVTCAQAFNVSLQTSTRPRRTVQVTEAREAAHYRHCRLCTYAGFT